MCVVVLLVFTLQKKGVEYDAYKIDIKRKSFEPQPSGVRVSNVRRGYTKNTSLQLTLTKCKNNFKVSEIDVYKGHTYAKPM